MQGCWKLHKCGFADVSEREKWNKLKSAGDGLRHIRRDRENQYNVLHVHGACNQACVQAGRRVSQTEREPTTESIKLELVRLRERDREQVSHRLRCAVLGESGLGCALEVI